ncbi:hypothetical protein CTAYLR_000517 [Chrysophaeum taylorii]|uniref:PHD-type domain-containing protein n=1 Tax=Chrysophaeum taylorii TaxID=2483200 RepID=A0AAD7UGT8_9STRA|nr:hypothetical protein CTAYLR_000517 [Chrysophaeum taylorii]
MVKVQAEFKQNRSTKMSEADMVHVMVHSEALPQGLPLRVCRSRDVTCAGLLSAVDAEIKRFGSAKVVAIATRGKDSFVLTKDSTLVVEALGEQNDVVHLDALIESRRDDSHVFCGICSSDDGDETPIIVCEGCEVGAHIDCYGLAAVPSGPWFCDACASGARNATCVACPSSKRYLLRATTSRGAFMHECCASYNTTLHFRGRIVVLPERLNFHSTRKHRCRLCGSPSGLAVPCRYGRCGRAAHVTCAIDGPVDWYVGPDARAWFCPAHSPDLLDKRHDSPLLTQLDDDEGVVVEHFGSSYVETAHL